MKTITISIFFLFVVTTLKSQTTDLMYVQSQKSLVATYNINYSPIGFYAGACISKSFPNQYINRTAISTINRAGISFSNGKFAVMCGAYITSYDDSSLIKPDIWLKIYPLRIITNTNRGFDFTLGINYMNAIHYGIGVSIPFGGIYY